MTKFVSLFRQHARSSDDSAKSPSVSFSSPTLVARNQASSDNSIEGDRLYEISTPADSRRIEIDIVAVHGLMGNPYTTWTKGRDPNGKPWISDFLPSQIPHARVFSYGYDSQFVRSSSVAGIPEFAMNLLAWLKLRRRPESERQRLGLTSKKSRWATIIRRARRMTFVGERCLRPSGSARISASVLVCLHLVVSLKMRCSSSGCFGVQMKPHGLYPSNWFPSAAGDGPSRS